MTSRIAVLVTTVLALGAGIGVMLRPVGGELAASTRNVQAERVQRDADIAFYRARARRDPTGAMDELRLAALHLQRARERGTPADLVQAEASARRSLANRTAHNGEAYRTLALSLVGQHRFDEARRAAESLLATDPSADGARSLLGEILLEIGAYRAADTIFAKLDRAGTDPAVAARTARWASLRGRSEHARALLLDAREEARNRFGTPTEQVAWFDLRLGELAMSAGRFRHATRHFERAAHLVPDDPRVLLGLARAAIARGHLTDAVDHATAAMNAGEDPFAFAVMSQALSLQGDTLAAGRFFRAFESAIAAAPPSAWHRQWQLALLDRGRQVDVVLAQAEESLARRRDVHGWDLYAWALHRAGRDDEARAAMQHALAWGTEDEQLVRHARTLGLTR